jgi:molybdopterin synthase sulfur carrier subunit
MKVTAVFFASIRETLGQGNVEVELSPASRVSDLINVLTDLNGQAWQVALTAENTKIAINQAVSTEDVALSDGDEIAFFPPVTGG